jgi:hypothetical protein
MGTFTFKGTKMPWASGHGWCVPNGSRASGKHAVRIPILLNTTCKCKCSSPALLTQDSVCPSYIPLMFAFSARLDLRHLRQRTSADKMTEGLAAPAMQERLASLHPVVAPCLNRHRNHSNTDEQGQRTTAALQQEQCLCLVLSLRH